MKNIIPKLKAAASKIGDLFTGFLDWLHGTRIWLKIEEFRYDPPTYTGRQIFWAAIASATVALAYTHYMRVDAVHDAKIDCGKIQGRLPKAEVAPMIPLLGPLAPVAQPLPAPLPKPPTMEAEVLNAKPDVKAAPRPPKFRSSKRDKPRRQPVENAIRSWSS